MTQFMPGDDSMLSPTTPQVERPSSPEPQEQTSSGRSTKPERPAPGAQRQDSLLTDIQPTQLLHTTFPYKNGEEDARDGENTPILQSPSADTVPESKVEIQVVTSIAQTPQYDHPSTAEVEEAPAPENSEAHVGEGAAQEAQPELVGQGMSSLFLPADQPTTKSSAIEEAMRALHASIFHTSDEPISHNADMDTIEAEKSPAVPSSPAAVAEALAVPIEDTVPIEAKEEDIPPSSIDTYFRTQLPAVPEEIIVPSENGDVPSLPPYVNAQPADSQVEPIPIPHDDAHIQLKAPWNPELARLNFNRDSTASSETESSSTSNSIDERTLDLVLRDREVWNNEKDEPVSASSLKAVTLVQEPASPLAWVAGTYTLTNVRSGTALDLSAGDYKTVIGWPAHGNVNQQVSKSHREQPILQTRILTPAPISFCAVEVRAVRPRLFDSERSEARIER